MYLIIICISMSDCSLVNSITGNILGGVTLYIWNSAERNVPSAHGWEAGICCNMRSCYPRRLKEFLTLCICVKNFYCFNKKSLEWLTSIRPYCHPQIIFMSHLLCICVNINWWRTSLGGWTLNFSKWKDCQSYLNIKSMSWKHIVCACRIRGTSWVGVDTG